MSTTLSETQQRELINSLNCFQNIMKEPETYDFGERASTHLKRLLRRNSHQSKLGHEFQARTTPNRSPTFKVHHFVSVVRVNKFPTHPNSRKSLRILKFLSPPPQPHRRKTTSAIKDCLQMRGLNNVELITYMQCQPLCLRRSMRGN